MIVIYKASAGSGKTYQLALSYLRLFKEYSSIKGLLAITFTNKAAYEMKSRIISFLKEIALEQERSLEIASKTGISPQDAQIFLEEIFLNYDYFEAKTIDSFLLKLFRHLAYELNLFSDFSVRDFLEEALLERAFLNLYQKAQREPEVFQFLSSFVDFILEKEEKIKLNLKETLIKQLKEFINYSTYREEFLKASTSKEVRFSNQENNFSCFKEKGKKYINLWSHLKEELEKVLFEEAQIYIGIWKEKLVQYLREDFLPWIYLKMGNIQGFMIDEFQDTDRLQWSAITPIVENLVSSGKPLYIAGDPKQTIFRWKGGDHTLFKDIEENFSPYNLKREVMKKNFRSAHSIVEFNNTLFSFIKEANHLKEEILKRLIFGKDNSKNLSDKEREILVEAMNEFDFIFFEPRQEATKPLDGRVYIEFLKIKEDDPKELINQLIYKHIEKILKEIKDVFGLSDTAILLRENDEVSALTSYLLSCGYQVIGSSFLKLKNSPLLNSLISFLKLFYFPKDEVALATVLSGLFGEEGKKILISYQNLRPYLGKFSLYDYLLTYNKDFFEEKILLPLKKGGLYNPYQLCNFLIESFNLRERFPFEEAYLNKFLSLLLKYTAQGEDLFTFIEAWESRLKEEDIEQPQETSSIKVLTIHSSKGLEFENVIIPLNFGVKPYRPPLGIHITDEGVYKASKKELEEISKENGFENVNSNKLLFDYHLNKFKHYLEIFNLLYVAFTRAIRNLYILIPDPPNKYLCAEIFMRFFEELKKSPSFQKIQNFLIENSVAPHNY